MPEITKNVAYNNVAREWRCKWSPDNDKASLTALQDKFVEAQAGLSAVDGVIRVQRIVCGSCMDFKVVTMLTAKAFEAWEKTGFEPEAAYLSTIKEIPGVSAVETQTYTLEDVKLSKKKAGKKEAPKEEKDQAADPEKAKKDLLKKAVKEGGKRGVEIEGAADMGGLQFFCCSVEVPEGDMDLLKSCVEAMNEKSDPTQEERKGGSGHIGKMVFSAGVEQLAIVAYVPEEKQDVLSCEEWLKAVLGDFQGKVLESSPGLCTGCVQADGDKGVFPLKIREPMILAANNFLRKKGLFPQDNGDSDEEMVFGDDDFPS